jgi:hypothetical protein
MSHLPTERLAALADEAPTAAELAHLAGCTECSRERAAYQNLAELAAAEAARLGAPLTTWETLAPVLVADGVIDDGRGLRFRTRRAGRPWLQTAAAVLLLAGGVATGRWSMHAPALGSGRTVAANNMSTNASTDSTPVFRTVQEALVAQAQSQTTYQSATAYLAQHDTTGQASESPSAMRARLAALDRTRDVMGEALNEAPYDPVINGYYLTTVGQREATIRRLNTVLPASMRVTSY